jgi:hypothetical protein
MRYGSEYIRLIQYREQNNTNRNILSARYGDKYVYPECSNNMQVFKGDLGFGSADNADWQKTPSSQASHTNIVPRVDKISGWHNVNDSELSLTVWGGMLQFIIPQYDTSTYTITQYIGMKASNSNFGVSTGYGVHAVGMGTGGRDEERYEGHTDTYPVSSVVYEKHRFQYTFTKTHTDAPHIIYPFMLLLSSGSPPNGYFMDVSVGIYKGVLP